MKLGLREANQRFSQTMQAVRRGEEVVLTERGRPIAVIKPLVEAEQDSDAAALRKMTDAGLIVAAAEPGPMPTPRWRPVAVTGKPVSETIIEDRDDRT
jgi:prevent-host-death family protein